MTGPLRVLVVGGRGVGATHIQALQRIPEALVMAVAAASSASAREAARRFDIPRWSGDYQELIDQVDVVHVCTPSDLHLPVLADALAAGKHVVCEKPIAANAEDAAKMVRLACAATGQAFLCYKYRYLRLLQQLRTLIGDGALGDVHAIRGHYLQSWKLAADPQDWRLDPSRAGSPPVVFDIGTHLIDLVEQVIGRPATDPLLSLPAGDRDLAQAGVLFHLGAIAGSIAVSQVSAGSDNHLQLQVDGAHATATWMFDESERLAVTRQDGDEALSVNAFRSARHVTTTSWESVEDASTSTVALFHAIYRQLTHPDDRSAGPAAPLLADGLRHVRFLTAAPAPVGAELAAR